MIVNRYLKAVETSKAIANTLKIIRTLMSLEV